MIPSFKYSCSDKTHTYNLQVYVSGKVECSQYRSSYIDYKYKQINYITSQELYIFLS